MDLTSCQYQVAEKITQGLSQKEIADELCVSRHTVKNHIANICKKTGARSSVDIARQFILSLENPKKYFAAMAMLVIQISIIMHCTTMDLRRPVRPSTRLVKTSRKS